MRTIIEHAWVLTMDPQNTCYKDGYVIIEGSKILKAGDLATMVTGKRLGHPVRSLRTPFARNYFDELVLSHVDNVNTLYVATTRAEEELHIMIPDPTKSSADKISSLIRDSITVSDGEARLGRLSGKAGLNEYCNIMEFGSPVSHSATSDPADNRTIKVPFKAYGLENRLKIKYRASRYMEDGVTPAMSPRDYGILMHKIFEYSKTKEDIQRSIEEMSLSGEIRQPESIRLADMIAEAFRDPVIESWFSDEWDEIHNENSIIVPKGSGILRPDRVMTKGNKAIVVDYKFGLESEGAHTRQIKKYMQLMSRMGYTNIEGYIWYVSSGKIVHI